nr:MAG TPA: hypothetical protein [Caudoviricetes sp.]
MSSCNFAQIFMLKIVHFDERHNYFISVNNL